MGDGDPSGDSAITPVVAHAVNSDEWVTALTALATEPANAVNAGQDHSVDDNSLRIETWSRPNADGTGRNTYWQWSSRTTKAGKQGGKKWRSYGGSIISGRYTESTGVRGGRRNRKG